MASNFIQSSMLRMVGLSLFRLRARARGIGSKGPRVYINSLPKSGTHLLTAELAKLGQLTNSYLHVKTKSVGQNDVNGEFRIDCFNIERIIKRVPCSQFFSGHLPYDPELVAIMRKHNVVVINLIRDPRDMLLSMAYYIAHLKRHPLHREMRDCCPDLSSQVAFLLNGKDRGSKCGALGLDRYFPPYATVLERFAGWQRDQTIYTVRFEDLVGERGGGNNAAKRRILWEVSQHIGLDGHVGEIEVARGELKTPTFRKGIIGDWKESFESNTVELCDEQLGPHLKRMGYA